MTRIRLYEPSIDLIIYEPVCAHNVSAAGKILSDCFPNRKIVVNKVVKLLQDRGQVNPDNALATDFGLVGASLFQWNDRLGLFKYGWIAVCGYQFTGYAMNDEGTSLLPAYEIIGLAVREECRGNDIGLRLFEDVCQRLKKIVGGPIITFVEPARNAVEFCMSNNFRRASRAEITSHHPSLVTATP